MKSRFGLVGFLAGGRMNNKNLDFVLKWKGE